MFNQAAIKKNHVSGTRYISSLHLQCETTHTTKLLSAAFCGMNRARLKNEQRRSGNKQTTGTNCRKQISKCKDLLHIISMRQPFFPKQKRKKTSSKILLHPQVPHLETKKTHIPHLKQASCKVRSLKLTFHLPPSTCTKSLAPLPFRKFISAASNLG